MENWAKELKMAITVCDLEGVIVYMNDQSCHTFQKPGEQSLIGTNMLSCHPETARQKIHALMKTGANNAYTIEKNGKKKIIFQTPWIVEGQIRGLVECSFEIPFEMPNFIRKST